MKKNQFVRLLKRYFKRKASHDDQSLVEGWYNYFAKQQNIKMPAEQDVEADLDLVWKNLTITNAQKAVKINTYYRRLVAYAASIFLLISTGLWFFVYNKPVDSHLVTIAQAPQLDSSKLINEHDVFVQMQSGGRLNLDQLSLGDQVVQERVLFQKNVDGELVYKPQVSEWEQTIVSNKKHTVFVPKSKRSTIVLSDGTKVWMNSESTVTFPEVFAKNERVVEITGEVFFDVEKDVLRPFYVKTKDATIKVIGTEFNVSTYEDEPLSSTTLVSGVVSILKFQSEKIPSHVLKPGQQWKLNRGAQESNVSYVNVNDIISWREGRISFTNLDLKSIMRRVSRTYDVEIEFSSYDDSQRFTGGITSKTTLDEFIKIMSMYQVKIEKQGKKLYVSNN